MIAEEAYAAVLDSLPLQDLVERKLKRLGKLTIPYRYFISTVEEPFIRLTLKEWGGNQVQCANALMLNRNTLRKKIKALRIGDGQARAPEQAVRQREADSAHRSP